LTWYAREQRDLPWRRSRDPYAIWVSEIMLQQTRVEAVIPYYERFMARFATVEALAQAPLDDVLKMWAGLGYYSRARNLHAAAQTVVLQHAGRFPTDPEAIRGLPGIGRYTAGAIASIAFDAPAPIVDGNVSRVFARWFCVRGDVQSPAVVKRMWAWAGDWAQVAAAGDANQALMELGALVCTKPVPACERCPVESLCAARQAGCAADVPRPKRRQAPQRVELDVLLAEQGQRLLLVRRTSGTLLRDWWEAPSAHGRGGVLPAARLEPPAVLDRTAALGRFAPATARRIGATRHGILQHRLHVTVWHTRVAAAEATPRAARRPRHSAGPRERSAGANPRERSLRAAPSRRPPARAASTPAALANLNLEDLETRWVTSRECRNLPLATLTRKVLQEAARHNASWGTFLPQRPHKPAE